jgi:hypothetical protein
MRNKNANAFLVVVVAVFALMSAQAWAESDKSVVFYAMGDVLYGEADDGLLPTQVAELPDDAEFVVHVGDIKTGATHCNEPVYRKVSGMLAKSRFPTFIIPGDNEWNDCVDPASAWLFWEKYFLRFEQRWQHGLPVFRQLEREENFSFFHRGVLFIGLNIVGGRVHDAEEWPRRHAENLAWVQQNLRQFGERSVAVVIFGHAQPRGDHDDFFLPLCEEATKLAKPFLYLHGDGHRWIHDRPFNAKNILRVQVDQGGIAPPLQVVVDSTATEVFKFDRRLPSP